MRHARYPNLRVAPVCATGVVTYLGRPTLLRSASCRRESGKGCLLLGSELSALPYAREVHLSPRVFCEQGFTKLGPAHLPSSGAVADGSGGGLRGEVGVGVKLRREGRESDYFQFPPTLFPFTRAL